MIIFLRQMAGYDTTAEDVKCKTNHNLILHNLLSPTKTNNSTVVCEYFFRARSQGNL